MGKHIDAKTKYHYVMRYLNGESQRNLTDSILRMEFYISKRRESKD